MQITVMMLNHCKMTEEVFEVKATWFQLWELSLLQMNIKQTAFCLNEGYCEIFVLILMYVLLILVIHDHVGLR